MVTFRMPSLGADMETGTVVEWRVAPGGAVARGDVVCVVETDKGAIEVECWDAGTVAALVAPLGEKLPVGAPLLVLAEPGEAVDDVARTAAQQTPTPAAAAPAATAPAPVRASPAARRRAQELGVDLAAVAREAGEGPVQVADVERAAAAAPAARAGAPGAPADDRRAAMRHAIAAAMARSKREIPHYYLGTEILVEAAATWLERRNAERPVTGRVLMAALLLRAVALALREAPELNGHFVDGAFRPGTGIHPGVAVALRGGGLVAPAIHDADALPLDDLMARLADLLTRARADQLRGSELTDATVTVTSLGDLGVDAVYGVINPPQVALVGLGRVGVKPAVIGGQVVPARTLVATLSADHRVSDGLRGARFLAALDRLLQHPEELA